MLPWMMMSYGITQITSSANLRVRGGVQGTHRIRACASQPQLHPGDMCGVTSS
jgi:hypothetical protein